MQQTFPIFQDDFAKSIFGHYFCPFFSFPKKSWKKKYANLYNKWIYLLKGNSFILKLKRNKWLKVLQQLLHLTWI
jgi:hypothetical protein